MCMYIIHDREFLFGLLAFNSLECSLARMHTHVLVVCNCRPIKQLTVLKRWLNIWTLGSRPIWRQSAPIILGVHSRNLQVAHGRSSGKRTVTSRNPLLVYSHNYV